MTFAGSKQWSTRDLEVAIREKIASCPIIQPCSHTSGDMQHDLSSQHDGCPAASVMSNILLALQHILPPHEQY